MLTTLSFVFALALMVMVHELGHFLVARWHGIKVLEFSFGFGPKIVGYQGKETFYTWRLIPLGGYVKLYGIDAETNDKGAEVIAPRGDSRSFMNKNVWQRIAVIAAGSLMNFVLAIVLFVLVFACIGVPGAGDGNIIGSLVQDKPAEKSGLQKGDRIIAVDNILTPDWNSLTKIIHGKPNQTILLTVQRGQEQKAFTFATVQDAQTGNGIIGVQPEIVFEQVPIVKAISLGFTNTYIFTREILISLMQMITGKIPAEVGGPVAIAQVIGEAAHQGLANFLLLTGLLNVNLGLINLLPIPALDGSRLIFLLIEGFRRKPIQPEKENLIHLAGFLLLIALMLVITYQDIVRIFSKSG
ncbi:MAG: M50 family metallopeptidase [Desulfitobacteriaceae bacterium]|nr:M50 family metallopeptidase [Desulfitobacteriaceae bacterium]MDD4345597.1 M50 family metallopeptidase [Desulfitobacteriaceae bacterium]MDD4400912.1 M50 family metallopeptidase [Desulfitobacteriaceae bacterium]